MWRSKVSSRLRRYLDKEVRSSLRELKAIRLSKDKSVAQLWVAIASLSKQIDSLNQRLVKLEVRKKSKVLVDSLEEM